MSSFLPALGRLRWLWNGKYLEMAVDGAVWAWVSRTTKPRLCAELRKEANGHALDTCSCVQMRAGLWAGSC